MTAGIERRKHARERADAAVELIWKDESGNRRFECGRLVDCSPGGSRRGVSAATCRVVLSDPARARHWRRRAVAGPQQFPAPHTVSSGARVYRKAAIQPPDPAHEPDYHELLRVGVTGDADRLDRLYRTLAFRYHPDNGESGNAEVFLRIKEAYRILSASQPRYVDTEVAKPFEAFRCTDEVRELNSKRGAVLGLLCQRRMSDYRNAAVSQGEFESVTGLTSDELGFVLWYLREKGAVTLPDNGSDYYPSSAPPASISLSARIRWPDLR